MTSTAVLPPRQGESIDDAGHALAVRLRASVVAVYHHGGAGSGTPWPGDGLVVTNSHVVPGEVARVSTADGAVADARVIARDTTAGLALLRVALPGLASLPVRLDPPLHVGELVYAMGNPWGERGVLTAGVVLAGGSGRRADGAFAPVRADLRLAPGNSGGPMTDASGRVVGINSMIMGGLAIAIPAAVIEAFVRGATGAQANGYDR
jgi:serine protease Do